MLFWRASVPYHTFPCVLLYLHHHSRHPPRSVSSFSFHTVHVRALIVCTYSDDAARMKLYFSDKAILFQWWGTLFTVMREPVTLMMHPVTVLRKPLLQWWGDPVTVGGGPFTLIRQPHRSDNAVTVTRQPCSRDDTALLPWWWCYPLTAMMMQPSYSDEATLLKLRGHLVSVTRPLVFSDEATLFQWWDNAVSVCRKPCYSE